MPRHPSELGIMRGKGARRERRERIDLGLALLQMLTPPGVALSRAEQAAWCDCSETAIYLIEMNALRKIRSHLRMTDDPAFRELTDKFLNR